MVRGRRRARCGKVIHLRSVCGCLAQLTAAGLSRKREANSPAGAVQISADSEHELLFLVTSWHAWCLLPVHSGDHMLGGDACGLASDWRTTPLALRRTTK